MADVERLRRELAAYFCDDDATFRLDDCIKTFSAFFDSFRKAVEVLSSVLQLLIDFATSSVDTTRMHSNMKRSSVRLYVRLSHRLTTATAASRFAAERPVGRRYRSTAAT